MSQIEPRQELAEGGVTGRKPRKARRPKRGLAKEMPGRAEAYTPVANLALLAKAEQSGVLPRDLFAGFERIEWALHQVALALCICQPRNSVGTFSVRWWRTDGQHSWLRRQVLVRLHMHGGALVPRKVVGRMPKLRVDGAFSTNADLVPSLLAEYKSLYNQWLSLRDLVAKCMAFDRGMRRYLAKADQAVAHQAGLVPALMRAGRGRAEAAGYDMAWVDRLQEDALAEAASSANAVNG